MTFLELCQMVARESGTVAGKNPASVEDQSGVLLKIVEWTQTAWNSIQTERNAWQWMIGELDGVALTPGTQRYTASSLGLTRHSEWRWSNPDGSTDIWWAYKDSEGVADEYRLELLPWFEFRRQYLRGEQQAQRPMHISESPAGEIVLGPAPDVTYRLSGEYLKSPQVLVGNDDEPEMPARFHRLIGWEALLLLAFHDEAEFHVAHARTQRDRLMCDLERDQLPTVYWSSGPLA